MHKWGALGSSIKPRHVWWWAKNNGRALDHRNTILERCLVLKSKRAEAQLCRVVWGHRNESKWGWGAPSSKLSQTKGGSSPHPLRPALTLQLNKWTLSAHGGETTDIGDPLQIPWWVMNAKEGRHRHTEWYLMPVNGLHLGAYCDNLKEHKIKFPFNEEPHTMSEKAPLPTCTKAGACFPHN